MRSRKTRSRRRSRRRQKSKSRVKQQHQKQKRKRRIRGGHSNFRKFGDSYFHIGWNLLTLLRGTPNRTPLSENEQAISRLSSLISDPFVRSTYINNDLFLDLNAKKYTIVFFQGLGTSLSSGIDNCEILLQSLTSLGCGCALYVMDQMQSLSMDLLIASAAELIEKASQTSKSAQSQFVVLGFSLGTGVAVYGLLRWFESYESNVSSLPAIPKVILLSPFTSLSDVKDTSPLQSTALLDYSFRYALGHNLEVNVAMTKLPFSFTISSSTDDEIIVYDHHVVLGKVKNLLGDLPTQISVPGDHFETRRLLGNTNFVQQIFSI